MNQAWTSAQMPSQTGKVILVTGANGGIGYQAALEFARHGAQVWLGCRDRDKGQHALQRLKQAVPEATVYLAEVDLSSLDSVRSFASQLLLKTTVVDVLVNNAGVMALPQREVTADGFERQFATNHLGHFALTGLLLPALKAAPMARVVTVASLAHRNGVMAWDDLQEEKGYEGWKAYNQSKLANILFARELDKRARKHGMALLSLPVHPGISRTNIFKNGPGTGSLKARMLALLAPVVTQNDAMGALPTEYAATAAGVTGGQYIGPSGFKEFKGHPTVVQPRPHALDQAAGERLWTVSEELTGVRYLS